MDRGVAKCYMIEMTCSLILLRHLTPIYTNFHTNYMLINLHDHEEIVNVANIKYLLKYMYVCIFANNNSRKAA